MLDTQCSCICSKVAGSYRCTCSRCYHVTPEIPASVQPGSRYYTEGLRSDGSGAIGTMPNTGTGIVLPGQRTIERSCISDMITKVATRAPDGAAF